MGLITEISNLSNENYRIKLEVASHPPKQESEAEIQSLQEMLERESNANQDLVSESEELKGELFELEKELNTKNKKIKLLSLNLNRK